MSKIIALLHGSTGHWFAQRLTAIVMAPLVVYLLVAFIMGAGADYLDARAFIARPFNAVGMVLVFGAGFIHANLGLESIMDDYIQGAGMKRFLRGVIKLASLGLAGLAVFSILSIALGQ